jgi:hypothetical protein
LIGERDPTLVDDPGEGIVVRLLIPAGVVILGVCHLVLAQVSADGSQEQPWILCTAQNSVNIHAKRVVFRLVEDLK